MNETTAREAFDIFLGNRNQLHFVLRGIQVVIDPYSQAYDGKIKVILRLGDDAIEFRFGV